MYSIVATEDGKIALRCSPQFADRFFSTEDFQKRLSSLHQLCFYLWGRSVALLLPLLRLNAISNGRGYVSSSSLGSLSMSRCNYQSISQASMLKQGIIVCYVCSMIVPEDQATYYEHLCQLMFGKDEIAELALAVKVM